MSNYGRMCKGCGEEQGTALHHHLEKVVVDWGNSNQPSTNYGWECPKCNSIMSPKTINCTQCKPTDILPNRVDN